MGVSMKSREKRIRELERKLDNLVHQMRCCPDDQRRFLGYRLKGLSREYQKISGRYYINNRGGEK